MKSNHYAVLGLLPTAETAVIKAAYKALAQRYHPDTFDGDPAMAHAKMAALNLAYQVLSDPDQRRDYDQALIIEIGDSDHEFVQWVRAFVNAHCAKP